MKTHWKHGFFSAIFLACLVLFSSAKRVQQMEPVFGVAFGYNQMNEFYHLVAYQRVGTNLINKMVLRRDQFIYYFSGYYPSRYNPTRINYFDEYHIAGGIFIDTVSGEKIPFCPALDSLWKIRYSEYPVQGGNEHGWSNGDFNPSENQMNYLRTRYHIPDLHNSYILDTNFIHLLQDVMDSTWVENYKALQ